MRADPRLPGLSARILRWATLRLGTPEVEADAVELFEERAARDGLIAARRWYRRQARIAARQALRPQPRPRSGASGVGVITFADATLRELRLGARRLRRRPGAAVSFAAVVGTGIAAASFMADFGALISFDPTGPGERASHVCERLELIHHATSLGGVESTMERRAVIEGQERIPPSLIRFSVGCEDVEDIWEDLDAALVATRVR